MSKTLINFTQLQGYMKVAIRLRGAPGKSYTNKVQYSIDRVRPSIDCFVKEINEEQFDSRVKYATVDGEGNLIEKESGTDPRTGENITRFLYTPENRLKLEKANRESEMKARQIDCHFAPEDTNWESLVNAAEYEFLRGILFDANREYDLAKVLNEPHSEDSPKAKMQAVKSEPVPTAPSEVSAALKEESGDMESDVQPEGKA
jgi:hypothetical protein